MFEQKFLVSQFSRECQNQADISFHFSYDRFSRDRSGSPFTLSPTNTES